MYPVTASRKTGGFGLRLGSKLVKKVESVWEWIAGRRIRLEIGERGAFHRNRMGARKVAGINF